MRTFDVRRDGGVVLLARPGVLRGGLAVLVLDRAVGAVFEQRSDNLAHPTRARQVQRRRAPVVASVDVDVGVD